MQSLKFDSIDVILYVKYIYRNRCLVSHTICNKIPFNILQGTKISPFSPTKYVNSYIILYINIIITYLAVCFFLRHKGLFPYATRCLLYIKSKLTNLLRQYSGTYIRVASWWWVSDEVGDLKYTFLSYCFVC